MYDNLAIIAVFVFVYSLVSGGLERTLFYGAVVFTAFGIVFGPFGFGLLHLSLGTDGLRTLAELTLALVLFTDAANANLKELEHSYRIPGRLLLLGLPLTLLLGYGIGLLLFDKLSWLEIAILATMLAPTDAALGKVVVTNTAVPANIREGLNVESGLNDGICVPILFVFLAMYTAESIPGSTAMLALSLVGGEIGIAIVVAIVTTLLGSTLIQLCESRRWITESWHQLPVPALALACFSIAQWMGGSGFIACFVGGLLFGGLAKRKKHSLLLAAEGTGDTLALITWVLFGTLVGEWITSFSWQVLLYAVLSLTLVRILPVFLALVGLGLTIEEKLFIGWFGPRGLASIVFAVIVIGENLQGGDTVSITVVCTILLSIILHGLTANPLVAALAARLTARSVGPK